MTRVFDASEELYIDSWTKDAFNETGGGTYITQEQLAAIGQVARSRKGCDIFQALTGRDIGSKAGLKALFESAAKGEISLPEILTSKSLTEYVNRRAMFALD